MQPGFAPTARRLLGLDANAIRPDSLPGAWLLRLRHAWQQFAWRPRDQEERAQKAAARRVSSFTMVDVPRLRTLLRLSKRVVDEGIEGAIVECGCWRGGALALLDWNVRRLGSQRPIFAFDSFAGLPTPGARDGQEALRAYVPGWCRASPSDLARAATRLGGSSACWRVVPGWFDETLRHTDTGRIALLVIDADWYESVRSCLEHLHDRVVPGGIVVVDDYGRWVGCGRAVDEFVATHEEIQLIRESRYGVYWRRACEVADGGGKGP